MAHLRFDIGLEEGGPWTHVRDMQPGEQYGSFMDMDEGGGTSVIMFGIDLIENRAVIIRSLGGLAVEEGVNRVVTSLETEAVDSFEPGQHRVLHVRHRSGEPMWVKLSFMEETERP
jgi:hypothetical protein